MLYSIDEQYPGIGLVWVDGGYLVNAGLLTREDAGPGRRAAYSLRIIHLGETAPERDGPSVMERLAKAYAAAL